jgi:hypothetical protein
MADDQDVKPPREVFPEGRGPNYMVWWPTPTAPRYLLAWGELGAPPQLRTWGLATFEGAEFTEGRDCLWHRPKEVTGDELRAWLTKEAKVEPEAVSAMVAEAMASRPDLFADLRPAGG